MVRVDGENAKGSGLLMDSVIMTDNLATIQYSEIDRVIGALTGLSELDAALANDPGIVAGTKACARFGGGPRSGFNLRNVDKLAK